MFLSSGPFLIRTCVSFTCPRFDPHSGVQAAARGSRVFRVSWASGILWGDAHYHAAGAVQVNASRQPQGGK